MLEGNRPERNEVAIPVITVDVAIWHHLALSFPVAEVRRTTWC